MATPPDDAAIGRPEFSLPGIETAVTSIRFTGIFRIFKAQSFRAWFWSISGFV
jgi:hypothetical protein